MLITSSLRGSICLKLYIYILSQIAKCICLKCGKFALVCSLHRHYGGGGDAIRGRSQVDHSVTLNEHYTTNTSIIIINQQWALIKQVLWCRYNIFVYICGFDSKSVTDYLTYKGRDSSILSSVCWQYCCWGWDGQACKPRSYASSKFLPTNPACDRPKGSDWQTHPHTKWTTLIFIGPRYTC